MSHLLKLSEMNKELKRVGWMNSKEAALIQFELNPERYEDWKVRADRDISGDGIPDVVILNKHNEIMDVNQYRISTSGGQKILRKLCIFTMKHSRNPIDFLDFTWTKHRFGASL